MGVTAVIFPGQGTQGPQMGRPWRDQPVWELVERAEAALGAPLAPLLLAETADEVARTREAQLSVLLTSLLAWEAGRDAIGTPVAFAGHSLGQITALIAAGALRLEDGVRLAAERAELTQDCADRRPGRMAALLGADEAQAQAVCAESAGECWLANDNAPGQLVVAGTPEGLDRAAKAAERIGIRRVMPLKVGGAFHTPLMAEAADGFAGTLRDVPLADPSAPVVSNADGRPYGDGEGWRARLVDHLVSPVRWRQSMTTLVEELGVAAFVEVGYGTMLAGLAKRGAPGTPVVGVAGPADVAALRGRLPQ